MTNTTVQTALQIIVEIFRIAPILAALIVLALVDYKERRVPNNFLLALLGLRGVIYVVQLFTITSIVQLPGIFLPDFITALVFGGFFMVCSLVIKGGMGMGDIKLIAVISLFLGFKMTFLGLMAAMFASFLAAIYFVVVKKMTRSDAVPFVPFLTVGMILSVIIVELGVI